MTSDWRGYMIVKVLFPVLLICVSVNANANIFTMCEAAKPDNKIAVVLVERKAVSYDGSNWNMGLFEIRNNQTVPVELKGYLRDGSFYMWDPEVYINIQLRNRQWITPLYPIGDGPAPPDKLVIQPNSSASFLTRLDLGYKLKGINARIALYNLRKGICTVSESFHISA
jgi:hypothetical protein